MLEFANNSKWQWHAICIGQWHIPNLPIYRFNPFLTNYPPSNMAFACFLFLLLVIMIVIVCFLFRDYRKRILCIVEMLCAFLVFSSCGLPGKNPLLCTLLCASTYLYKRPILSPPYSSLSLIFSFIVNSTVLNYCPPNSLNIVDCFQITLLVLYCFYF